MSDPLLVGLCGALRADSANRKLLIEATRLFGPCQFAEGNLRLPLFDEDQETADGIPQSVQTLADQITAADAVLISTPEYNKAPPGVLKNALDWISRTEGNPWRDKPVAVMSAAAGRAGGERSQSILRLCLTSFQPRLLSGPEVHIANCRAEFDDAGRLKSDRYRAAVEKLMDRVRAEISR